MNKAAEIRAMFIECPHWTTTEIGNAIGVSDSYVRAVRQRLDPERRKRDARAMAARLKTGNKEEANNLGRIAYREARKRGASRAEANAAYRIARMVHLLRSGSSAVQREAWYE